MNVARGLLAAVAGLSALATACGADEPFAVHARFGVLPQSLDACPAEPVPKTSYADEVDLFRLKLTGNGLAEPLRKDFVAADAKSSGALQLDGVPAGSPRNLLISGLAGQGKSAVTLWRGAHLGFAVEVGKTAEVPVLMTKLATMTCSRTPLVSPRMFATATPLADGRVLVAGGFYQVASGSVSGTRDYTATDTAEIYDPRNGTFTATGKLTWKRGLHQAALLGDGRVLVVGGAEMLRYDPVHVPFQLTPQQLVSWIEVFDPATATFSQIRFDGLQPALVFHTVTALGDGRVLIAGGTSGLVDEDSATNASILCRASGSEVVCTAGAPMARNRLGHTATVLDDSRVFLWGGVTNNSPTGDCSTSAAVLTCPEWFRPGQDVFVPVDSSNKVLGANHLDNVFFATATRITTDVGTFVLIAGGLRRDYTDPGLAFELAPIADVKLYSPTEKTLGTASSTGYRLRGPRLFPSATELALIGRAFIAGGYNSLDLVPARDMEVFDFGQGGIQPDVTAEGQPVLLRQPRGGAAALHVGGSTVVVIGGEDQQSGGSGRTVLGTAEIYTDKMEPQL